MSVVSVGSGPIDTSFLDCLYTGGRLTGEHRDAILSGSDPSKYGLIPYDLYTLTLGRLGSADRAGFLVGPIRVFSAARTYQAGDLVLYRAGSAEPFALLQARSQVPPGTLPAAGLFWSLIVSPTPSVIEIFDTATRYWVGSIVLYQPPGAQRAGLYQLYQAAMPGTVPSAAAWWRPLSSPGPGVLLETDLVNPALAAVTIDESGALFQDVTAGVALPPISVPAGRRYRFTVSEIVPAVTGGSTPTDCHARVDIVAAESALAIGGVSVVLTPWWVRIPTANAYGPLARAAGTLAVRLRVELI